MTINNELLGLTSARLMDMLEAEHAHGEIMAVFMIAQIDLGNGHNCLRTARSPDLRQTELIGMLDIIRHDYLNGPRRPRPGPPPGSRPFELDDGSPQDE